MIRKPMIERGVGAEADFRWRGEEVSRLEGLSDAVFGFAITLLVVSLEAPSTFAELLDDMEGFLAFGVCFAMLMRVWQGHYRFFRRYGLADGPTTWLNALLLFVVVFYVYPLKFLFTQLADQVLGLDLGTPDGGSGPAINDDQWPTLMVIYGVGFAAVSLVFALLYAHALRLRAELELTEAEARTTRGEVESYLVSVLVAAVSILVALVGGPGFAVWSGLTYLLLAPFQAMRDVLEARRARTPPARPG